MVDGFKLQNLKTAKDGSYVPPPLLPPLPCLLQDCHNLRGSSPIGVPMFILQIIFKYFLIPKTVVVVVEDYELVGFTLP